MVIAVRHSIWGGKRKQMRMVAVAGCYRRWMGIHKLCKLNDKIFYFVSLKPAIFLSDKEKFPEKIDKKSLEK